jgi:hypothetical protein
LTRFRRSHHRLDLAFVAVTQGIDIRARRALDVTLTYAHLAPNFMASEVARLNLTVPIACVMPITQGQIG